jgi:hypothetical protein
MSKWGVAARHQLLRSSPPRPDTYAAIVDFRRPQWVLDNMTNGRDRTWLFTLGVLKAAGVLGLRGNFLGTVETPDCQTSSV